MRIWPVGYTIYSLYDDCRPWDWAKEWVHISNHNALAIYGRVYEQSRRLGCRDLQTWRWFWDPVYRVPGSFDLLLNRSCRQTNRRLPQLTAILVLTVKAQMNDFSLSKKQPFIAEEQTIVRPLFKPREGSYIVPLCKIRSTPEKCFDQRFSRDCNPLKMVSVDHFRTSGILVLLKTKSSFEGRPLFLLWMTFKVNEFILIDVCCYTVPKYTQEDYYYHHNKIMKLLCCNFLEQ